MLKKGVSRAADGKAGEEMQMEVVSCTKQAKTLTARQHRSYVVFHLPGLQQSICSMQKLSEGSAAISNSSREYRLPERKSLAS
ncbi:uncharacterized protein LOC120282341 isoform X2 [Dioscorea cayenensis subsp. rotundata]|uniref:Uncharacterized protein LOC120282341 isoform X2 n=1 Tax=Dioscorea cayennensis subsp. rotundata TaxID=55577 RepID=A0AB40D086_DIOCR|nr:uncharacterized protein LOC120282341 isoform X2 [Dioscorea cayenensis subsp. rotundata]